MTRNDEPVEGRTRRVGQLVLIGVGVALLLALPQVYGLVSSDAPLPRRATERGPTSPNEPSLADARLHGRVVFTALDSEGTTERRQRLWVFDVQSGALEQGPLVPAVQELWITTRSPHYVVIAADGGSEGVVYVLDDLSPDTEPVEVARGDVISLATDGRALIVGRNQPAPGKPPGCDPHTYTLHRVDLASSEEVLVLRGRVDCGALVSATLHSELAVASFVDRGGVEVRTVWPTNVSTLFPDLAHVSVSPRGTFLFVDPGRGELKRLGVWPRTPTGRLLVWPESGQPRPLVTDARLVGQRVVAWSPDGSHVIVNGSIRDRRGMWLVYAPAGTAELLLPPSSFRLRSPFSGAAFDDAGDVFAAIPGRIVVRTDTGRFPITLPPDAPSPIGPIGWLP